MRQGAKTGSGCHLPHAHSTATGAIAQAGEPLSLSNVHHIGMVVADRDKTMAGLADMFAGPSSLMDATFPPARFRTGIAETTLRLGFAWTGNLLIEVLQPVDEHSLQGQFLKSHGEGLHHLGFIVPSIDDHLAAMACHRDEAIVADGTIPGNDLKWVYVENRGLPGAVIELIERSSAAEQFFQGIYDVTGGRFPG